MGSFFMSCWMWSYYLNSSPKFFVCKLYRAFTRVCIIIESFVCFSLHLMGVTAVWGQKSCPHLLSPPLLSHFSRVRLCATPEMVAHQAPLSLGFSRQHWSGVAISFSNAWNYCGFIFCFLHIRLSLFDSFYPFGKIPINLCMLASFFKKEFHLFIYLASLRHQGL